MTCLKTFSTDSVLSLFYFRFTFNLEIAALPFRMISRKTLHYNGIENPCSRSMYVPAENTQFPAFRTKKTAFVERDRPFGTWPSTGLGKNKVARTQKMVVVIWNLSLVFLTDRERGKQRHFFHLFPCLFSPFCTHALRTVASQLVPTVGTYCTYTRRTSYNETDMSLKNSISSSVENRMVCASIRVHTRWYPWATSWQGKKKDFQRTCWRAERSFFAQTATISRSLYKCVHKTSRGDIMY